jgi:hypothetical protein
MEQGVFYFLFPPALRSRKIGAGFDGKHVGMLKYIQQKTSFS